MLLNISKKSLLKKLLPLKGRWIKKTEFFEDGGVFLAQHG